jgi:hypothetical protein
MTTRPAIIDPVVGTTMLAMPLWSVWVILVWVTNGAAYWEGNRLCRMSDGYPILRVLGPNTVVMGPALPPE